MSTSAKGRAASGSGVRENRNMVDNSASAMMGNVTFAQTTTVEYLFMSAMRGTSMRENIDLGPPQQIQPCAGWQKLETGGGEIGAALAVQSLVQLGLEAVQMQNIRCGISLLRFGQGFRPPVRGLLLLGHVDIQQFLQQVLEAMPIRKGADQLGRDLGAVDRRGQRAKGMIHRGNVESAKVEQFQDIRIGQKPFEVRRPGLALCHMDQMCVAIPARKLDDAQPVAMGVQ